MSMALRQSPSELVDVVPEKDGNPNIKTPDWMPDLSAQKGVLGRLATYVMVYPRTSFVVLAVILAVSFLVLAPIVVAVVYLALGAGAYALWTRIRRLRMPRIVPLSQSSSFRLQNPRQDLTQLITLDLVAILFSAFGVLTALDAGQMVTGTVITLVFAGLAWRLTVLALKEMRGRFYFQ